ncbi:MAG TPA: ABC transporter permease [Planctomycetota bacterium]|nr:ABC transporter permease [Planctomycetota bacterium]
MSGLLGLFRSLRRHRELALSLTRRELFAPFAGSGFGVVWALLHPLLQTLVYVLVFTFVIKIRFSDAETPRLDMIAYMISGLLSWSAWATVLNNGCSSVIQGASLVKQADFPAEVLPVRTVLAAMVPQLVGIAVLLVYVLARFHVGLATWALLPLVLALQGLAMVGVAFSLGALSVFLRDSKELVTVFTTLGIYLTPAFYPPAMIEGLPAPLRWLLQLNPFTHFMNVMRDCLFWGSFTHPWSWLIVTLLSLLVAGVSYRVFDRLKIFFGNFV